MALPVISLLPLLVAFIGLQALGVVKLADRVSAGSSESRGLRMTPGGRYVGVA